MIRVTHGTVDIEADSVDLMRLGSQIVHVQYSLGDFASAVNAVVRAMDLTLDEFKTALDEDRTAKVGDDND